MGNHHDTAFAAFAPLLNVEDRLQAELMATRLVATMLMDMATSDQLTTLQREMHCKLEAISRITATKPAAFVDTLVDTVWGLIFKDA